MYSKYIKMSGYSFQDHSKERAERDVQRESNESMREEIRYLRRFLQLALPNELDKFTAFEKLQKANLGYPISKELMERVRQEESKLRQEILVTDESDVAINGELEKKICAIADNVYEKHSGDINNKIYETSKKFYDIRVSDLDSKIASMVITGLDAKITNMVNTAIEIRKEEIIYTVRKTMNTYTSGLDSKIVNMVNSAINNHNTPINVEENS